MATARTILQNALRLHLNRLSPGETADADTLDAGLSALNLVVDEWNGVKSFLFREILTDSAAPIAIANPTLGTNWTGLSPGDEILGATYRVSNIDYAMDSLTMKQYHERAYQKTLTGLPEFWAHDGLATVYLYPIPTGHTITLRTRSAFSDFSDIDTDYSMPKGYSSALSALVAERLAPTMLSAIPPALVVAAQSARNRIAAQAVNPAILAGRAPRGSILNDRGW